MSAIRDTRDKPKGTGFVYGIKPEGFDYLKIGYCRDTYDRLKTLQVAWPVTLEWVFLMRGDKDLELNIQGALFPSRIRGDWFRWDDLVQLFITKLLVEFPGVKPPEWVPEVKAECGHLVEPGGWRCSKCGLSAKLIPPPPIAPGLTHKTVHMPGGIVKD